MICFPSVCVCVCVLALYLSTHQAGPEPAVCVSVTRLSSIIAIGQEGVCVAK